MDNLRWAIEERVFLVKNPDGSFAAPPSPHPGAFGQLRAFQTQVLKRVGAVQAIAYDKYAELYTGRKRTLYEHAISNVLACGLWTRAHHIRAFLKFEKLQKEGAPRLISPRTPEYNVELGRYLRPAEHQIYRAIADYLGGPTVMKGYTVEQVATHARAHWDTFVDPVAIGLDASRFDQHVSVDALRYEHRFYTSIYPTEKYLGSLLRKQLVNEVFATCPQGSFKYQVHGTRASGDMNTALGNCILMCAMVWRFCAERGIPFRLLNNGDDCVVICERRYQGLFAEVGPAFLKYGFTMKVEPPVYEFEKMEFCQMHPVWAGDMWTMVRNPHKCLSKDLATCLPVNTAKEVRAWWSAVGQCGASLSGGVPILSVFYARLIELSQGAKPTSHHHFWESQAWSSKRCRHAQVTAEARLSFWRAYDIRPDHQEAMEASLRQWTPTPTG